jgi:PAS domain S-box-containing protein
VNLVSLLDLVAAFGSLAALLLILFRAKNTPWKPEITLFAFIIILTISHDAGNFLEWSGLTNWFDPVEDYLEVLTAALWAFFLYTFLQELTEIELRKSEEKYRRLFGSGNDAIFVFNIDENGRPGHFEEFNDEAVRRYGYSREELLNMSPADISSPENTSEVLDLIGLLAKSGQAVFERVHITKNELKVPVEISSHLFDYQGGKRVISICRDITERKKAERKLVELQELDEKILDGSPVAFVLRDADLRIVRVSKAFETVTGYDSALVVGKKIEEFMPDIPGRKDLVARLKKVLDSGEQVGPTEVKAPTPVERYIRENIFPVRDAEGIVVNTLSVLEDITIQVAMEKKLKEVQELDEKILDGSPVAFVLHDLDLHIIRVSRAYQDVTGFDPERVLGLHFNEFMPPGPRREGIISRIQDVQESGLYVGPRDIESAIKGHYIRETILPILDDEGKVVNTLSVLEDITEQKKSENALRHSEEQYKRLFESVNDGIVLHEMNEDGSPGLYIEANPTFSEMTGYSREELLKMTPLDISDLVGVGREEDIKSSLRRSEAAKFEVRIFTKEGETIPVELSAHSFIMNEKMVVLTVVRDIAERKRAEERVKSSLAEKETLLREVHHRVKNNLQVISGLLNLQSHYINDEEVRTIYKESQNRIKTMALIHEELYQREDLARINLADYIQGLTDNLMVSYSIKGNRVKLTLDLVDADIAIDTAIPCGLIVNELVSNALKHAFPGRKKGEVKVSLDRFNEEQYELMISDNGVGLPDGLDAMKTGSLGLRLVSVLAEQLGSELQVERDQGTTFRLTFDEYLEAGVEMY